MNERRRFIRRVEVLHAVVAFVAVLLTLSFWSGDRLSGVLAGALLGAANFRAMAMITERLTGSASASGRNTALGLLFGKLFGLIAAVAAVLFVLQPDPLAFILGLSLAPAALLIVATVARPDTALDDEPTGAEPQPGEVL